MNILLDNCTPRPLRRLLPGHEIRTAFQMGWANLKNGDLFRQAEAQQFDLLITTDTNMRYQQNLDRLRTALLLTTQDMTWLQKHREELVNVVNAMSAGEYREFLPRSTYR